MHLGNIVVTGGMGFIGSHFIRYLLEKYEKEITSLINVDRLTVGSNTNNLEGIASRKYKFHKLDINQKDELRSKIFSDKIDLVVNFAAETHVDRSIVHPQEFVRSNTNGAHCLLELCRISDVGLFVQISTDEVYGEIAEGKRATEVSPLKPGNPYAASKAAADHLTDSYFKTYGMKTLITRSCNNFGPNQYPEKLIPKSIIRALRGVPITIYGDGSEIREWLYVVDHIDALLKIVDKGLPGQTYNISPQVGFKNIQIAERIANVLSRKGIRASIQLVRDRPGHDRRYAIEASKITDAIEWHPTYNFDDALESTINWYLSNNKWWKNLKNDILASEPWLQS